MGCVKKIGRVYLVGSRREAGCEEKELYQEEGEAEGDDDRLVV